MNNISYRWINGQECSDEDWSKLAAIVMSQGWVLWNQPTTMVRVAETGEGEIVGFYATQLFPHAEPLFVKEGFRGKGIANRLADDMVEWMKEANMPGWLAIAENPTAAKMCEARGWRKLESPVYVVMRA